MDVTCFHKGTHLSESDLCEEDIHCPICQSTNRTNAPVLQEAPEIYLKQCQNCFAVSASRLPTEKTLDLYYSSFYQLNDDKVTFDDPKRFGWHLFDQTRKYLTGKKTLSILDYGGGIGTISIELAKRYLDSGVPEVKVIIVDYEQTAIISDSPNLVINRYSTLSEVKDQNFDIIIASAIVEHLPTPKTEITRLFELLNEHGLIYFRTPYVMPIIILLKKPHDAPGATGIPDKNIGGHFHTKLRIDFDFTYPAHIHDLGQIFWDNILETFDLKNGFNILSSRPSIVETTFSKHFGRTLIAYLCKAPWYALGNRWRFVGGWEIVIQKATSKTPVDNPEGGHDG